MKKPDFKRIVTIIIIALLLLAFLLPIFFSCSGSETAEESSTDSQANSDDKGESSMNDQKNNIIPVVAYIPLDNRPVNIDRVVYLAGAAGFEILTPETDLFSTVLDGAPLNENGTNYGNREGLLDWLKEADKTAEYFVISLDQMLSGGLANSRHMANTDLSLEYEILDYLINLTKSNKVYFFDTVMRLASTVGYNGYTGSEYSNLREYGKEARKILSDTELTVENIINGYRRGEGGETISGNLSDPVISSYLNSRARKLKLIDYLLQNCDRGNTYCFVGVDDSSPQNTIQTNEINYIKNLLNGSGELFAGADELGMMAFARFTTEYYDTNMIAGIKYFGNGKDNAADGYDIETLGQNLEKHIKSLGINFTEGSDGDLNILVLTSPGNSAQAASLRKKAEDNIKENIPTIIIDCSENKMLLGNNLYGTKNLAVLLGYSSWNTVGNSIGIALAQGVSRYLYIANNNGSEEADEAFLKSVAFSYCKDIGYRSSGINDANNLTKSLFGATGNFYSQIGKKISAQELSEKLLDIIYSEGTLGKKYADALSGSKLISSLMNGEAVISTAGSIRLYDAVFLWYRTFEIRFEISVE